jgi:uncharacterized SAM-binding protein YcdF (DUF218 family)
LVRASQPVPADLVVVLAGDFTGRRVLKGAELVRQGYAPQALISGPSGAYGMYECDLAIQFAERHGYPASYFIRLPHEARSTREEAAVIVGTLRERHAHTVDVVTSDYHTRRAGSILRAEAQGIDVHMVAAPDEYFSASGWWKNREGRKTFLLEWMKTVAGWFRL